MKKLQKILIPVDFSHSAVNAVRYAKGILAKNLTEVIMVYVNTPGQLKTEQEIKYAFKVFEAAELQDAPFYYEFRILKGHLLSELIYAGLAQDINLIMMGSKGKKTPDLSLASALIRSVACPVLVIPEHHQEYQISKIAFGNDYQRIKESSAIKPLWEFALEFRAQVYLLHINQPQKAALVTADEAESTLDYYMQSLEHKYVYLESEDMERGIEEFIKERGIDLLVILSRDHGDNQLNSESRLLARLTAHAEIPILALC